MFSIAFNWRSINWASSPRQEGVREIDGRLTKDSVRIEIVCSRNLNFDSPISFLWIDQFQESAVLNVGYIQIVRWPSLLNEAINENKCFTYCKLLIS